LINNTIDFDYAIKKITKKNNIGVYKQPDILDSESINVSFKNIENTLNNLYEKTRYLEDSIAYTKVFLKDRIADFSVQIDSVLHEIENIADVAKNLSYISYNVPFVNSDVTILDRDNLSKLKPLIIKNNNLTLDYAVDVNQDFATCKRISDSIPYKENLSSIKSEAYRTVYLEDKLQSSGLTETIVVHFDQPTKVNEISAKLVNCNMTNIRFGLINGIEELAGDFSLDIPHNTRICYYIKFDLVCTNYDMIKYLVDRTLIKDSAWNGLKEFEYNTVNNISNKADYSYIISRIKQNKKTGKTTTTNYASKDEKEIVTYKMYSYIFGLESLEFKDSTYCTDGYMISDSITIGHLKENEYIRLEVNEVSTDNSTIEYSIIDGDREIPINIMKNDLVRNELIFNNTDTRFPIGYDQEPIIKSEGNLIELSYIDAKDKALEMNKRYTISYKPDRDYYDYKPINKTIKVKCYIRTYGAMLQAPYITSISIHKYGEESLWINKF
jgi:hypothetical protein